MDETLLQRVMRHEGSQTKDGMHIVYKDSRGNNTLAYGTLVDFPGGLTEVEARYLLQNRLSTAGAEAKQSFPGFENLDSDRQGVIVEMVFQLGMSGVLEFKELIAAIAVNDFETAADQMLDSAWDKETPSRVVELAAIMRG